MVTGLEAGRKMIKEKDQSRKIENGKEKSLYLEIILTEKILEEKPKETDQVLEEKPKENDQVQEKKSKEKDQFQEEKSKEIDQNREEKSKEKNPHHDLGKHPALLEMKS